jgi:hypothetical protein
VGRTQVWIVQAGYRVPRRIFGRKRRKLRKIEGTVV